MLASGADYSIKLWNIDTAQVLHTLAVNSRFVGAVAFSPDGGQVIAAGDDGSVKMWRADTGELLATLIASRQGEWLTMTPRGFFASSRRDPDLLAVVRGLEVTTIGQVHQSLFNPDLVREALAGDPDGEVRRAAEIVSLEKVLDSGPAPAVEIVSHEPGSQSTSDLVTVAAHITDRGKGIGRIEWRVNGITVGVAGVPAGAGREYEVKQQLALDPGENKIEVIAYNGRNLLASLPAQTTIAYTGPADSVKPKLYILAIGINAYTDKGWALPGTSVVEAFPPLALAAGDAKSFAEEMKKAGTGFIVMCG